MTAVPSVSQSSHRHHEHRIVEPPNISVEHHDIVEPPNISVELTRPSYRLCNPAAHIGDPRRLALLCSTDRALAAITARRSATARALSAERSAAIERRRRSLLEAELASEVRVKNLTTFIREEAALKLEHRLRENEASSSDQHGEGMPSGQSYKQQQGAFDARALLHEPPKQRQRRRLELSLQQHLQRRLDGRSSVFTSGGGSCTHSHTRGYPRAGGTPRSRQRQPPPPVLAAPAIRARPAGTAMPRAVSYI